MGQQNKSDSTDSVRLAGNSISKRLKSIHQCRMFSFPAECMFHFVGNPHVYTLNIKLSSLALH